MHAVVGNSLSKCCFDLPTETVLHNQWRWHHTGTIIILELCEKAKLNLNLCICYRYRSVSDISIQSSSINLQRVWPEHCFNVTRIYQRDGHWIRGGQGSPYYFVIGFCANQTTELWGKWEFEPLTSAVILPLNVCSASSAGKRKSCDGLPFPLKCNYDTDNANDKQGVIRNTIELSRIKSGKLLKLVRTKRQFEQWRMC